MLCPCCCVYRYLCPHVHSQYGVGRGWIRLYSRVDQIFFGTHKLGTISGAVVVGLGLGLGLGGEWGLGLGGAGVCVTISMTGASQFAS